MALALSSPPQSPLHSSRDTLAEQLDADITRVRQEIQALIQRRKTLSASLLSSSLVQDRLQQLTHDTSSNSHAAIPQVADRQPLLLAQNEHNQSNIHRLAFGVTSFPFNDPSPEMIEHNPLLGIRFDIPSRSGKFEKSPYYIFCKKTTAREPSSRVPGTTLSIHQHTIPNLVPLQRYESLYLPQPSSDGQIQIPTGNGQERDEGYFGSSHNSPTSSNHNSDPSNPHSNTHNDSSDPTTHPPAQNLHALISAVRTDLASWTLRRDTISHVAESLGLPPSRSTTTTDTHSICTFEPTASDAHFARIVWSNGTVGRLKISDDGLIAKAVVIGEGGHLHRVERMLYSAPSKSFGNAGEGRLRLEDVLERLREVEGLVNSSGMVRGDDEEGGSEGEGEVVMEDGDVEADDTRAEEDEADDEEGNDDATDMLDVTTNNV